LVKAVIARRRLGHAGMRGAPPDSSLQWTIRYSRDVEDRSMIRTRRAALAKSGNRFSLATNAKRLRGDHAQKRDEIMIRFNEIGS
jgi:hypothetical protein